MHSAGIDSGRDAELLKRTLELAEIGIGRGDGGPFGALVARGGQVVSEAWNTVVSSNDPTAHAEVNAIRMACEKLKAFHLDGCTLYASSEPCPMCLATAYWARVDGIVFANHRHAAASIGFSDEDLYLEIALPPERRRMPHRWMAIEGAGGVMEKWAKGDAKVPY
jgi:tRNA(Arg) A34 adenosine deaminase TadA